MKNEEAPTNSVSNGGVSLPAHRPADKKKKKNIYDGRTKDGKALVKRILARREVKLKGAQIDEANWLFAIDPSDMKETEAHLKRAKITHEVVGDEEIVITKDSDAKMAEKTLKRARIKFTRDTF